MMRAEEREIARIKRFSNGTRTRPHTIIPKLLLLPLRPANTHDNTLRTALGSVDHCPTYLSCPEYLFHAPTPAILSATAAAILDATRSATRVATRSATCIAIWLTCGPTCASTRVATFSLSSAALGCTKSFALALLAGSLGAFVELPVIGTGFGGGSFVGLDATKGRAATGGGGLGVCAGVGHAEASGASAPPQRVGRAGLAAAAGGGAGAAGRVGTIRWTVLAVTGSAEGTGGGGGGIGGGVGFSCSSPAGGGGSAGAARALVGGTGAAGGLGAGGGTGIGGGLGG
jgi:hypothetical protein